MRCRKLQRVVLKGATGSLLLFFLILSGCSFLFRTRTEALNTTAEPMVFAPAEQGPTLLLQVEVKALKGETRFRALLERSESKTVLVGFNAFDSRAFTILQHGQQRNVEEQILVPLAIDPLRLFSDLQLIFWPVAVLREELPADVRIEELQSLRLTRTVFHAGRQSALLEYFPGPGNSFVRAALRRPEPGYQLVVRIVEEVS